MKKYTWILGGLMAMAITACTSDELMQSPEQQPAEGDVVSVTAYAPGSNADSRVNYVDGTNGNLFNLVWSVNDKFSVIRGNLYKTFSNGANGGNLFTGTYPNDGSGTYYAVYPYIASGTARPTAVPFDLSTQTGELYSDMTYMYASLTNGQTFSFSHCMSILKASFSFTGLTEDPTIKQIKVTTPDAYKVNGTINLSNSGTLTGATENGTNDITITIPVEEEPVSQAEGEEAYYIYLPPMTANDEGNTLDFEVTMSDDAVYTGTISRNGAIEAGKLYTATVVLSPLPTEPIPYVKFSSPSHDVYVSLAVHGTLTQDDVSLEYSQDNGENWNPIGPNQSAYINNNGNDLLLRGNCPNGTAKDINNYMQLKFIGNYAEVTCSGDIRTLVDYANYKTVDLDGKLFCSLFEADMGYYNTNLKYAQDLILGDKVSAYCYYRMFAYNKCLIEAPELPATSLAESCYESMFISCENLEIAPTLPAGTLAASCYKQMFGSCIKLNTVIMLATDISATNALFEWLAWQAGNQASNPTIYTTDGVTLTEGTHYPDYWSEEVYNN